MNNNHPNKDENKNNSQPDQTPISLRSSTIQTLLKTGFLFSSNSSTINPKSNITIKPKSSVKFVPKSVQTTATTKIQNEPTATLPLQTILSEKIKLQNAYTAVTNNQQMRSYKPPNISVIANNHHLHYKQHMDQKHKQQKSKDISELSWAGAKVDQFFNKYTPISLPFFQIINEDMKMKVDKNNQRPTIEFIDEANSKVSTLFNQQSNVTYLTWFLIQFPKILPALNYVEMNKQSLQEELKLTTDMQQRQKIINKLKYIDSNDVNYAKPNNDKNPYVSTNVHSMPEGMIGDIVIRQSGKVQLYIGNHMFDINNGSECHFMQEVGVYLKTLDEFFFIGSCNRKLIVTPALSTFI